MNGLIFWKVVISYIKKVLPIGLERLCFGCGFTTNDLMVHGEFDFDKYEELLPELHKSIKVGDELNRVWYPITVNIPDKGTVFANGKGWRDWSWAGVKVTEVKEEEKEKFKIPGKKDEYYKFKTDMKSLHEFDQSDFMDALEYIGFFK